MNIMYEGFTEKQLEFISKEELEPVKSWLSDTREIEKWMSRLTGKVYTTNELKEK